MKNRIARLLRAWANKLNPTPFTVYPTNGEIKYYGKTYRLLDFHGRKEIEPTTDYRDGLRYMFYKKLLTEEITEAAAQAIEWEQTENTIKANLLILINAD